MIYKIKRIKCQYQKNVGYELVGKDYRGYYHIEIDWNGQWWKIVQKLIVCYIKHPFKKKGFEIKL